MPFITISQWAKIRDSRVMKKLFYHILIFYPQIKALIQVPKVFMDELHICSYSILKLEANSLTLPWTFVSLGHPWADISLMETYQLQKSAIYPKSEWRELILSFPHTYSYRTYLSIGNGKKNTHTIITTRWKPQDPFFAASWPAYLCRWGEVPNLSSFYALWLLRQRNELSPSEIQLENYRVSQQVWDMLNVTS